MAPALGDEGAAVLFQQTLDFSVIYIPHLLILLYYVLLRMSTEGTEMYKVIFSVNNNEEVWTLPHVPADLEIPSPAQSNETYNGLSRDYRRIGTMELISMSWKGLLPVGRRYAFMPAEASEDGWAYKDFFDRWRDRKVPFRLIILDSGGVARLNIPVTVDDFSVTVRRSGDLNYSVSVTEYRFIK